MDINKSKLLISTGHNSSVIYINDNGKTVIGYEEERINGEKSSSEFPLDSINEISKKYGFNKIISEGVYINTWFDRFSKQANQRLSKEECEKIAKSKYINEFFVKENREFISYNTLYFTHHDSHMFSSLLFFKHFFKDYKKQGPIDDKIHFIVADGFGNSQEVLSIYNAKISELTTDPKSRPYLLHRRYKYMNSLGLMYQYATSYVGMKENQDEYKFLGYESLVDRYFEDRDIRIIKEHALNYSNLIFNKIYQKSSKKPSKEFDINLDDLSAAKKYFYSVFNSVISVLPESNLLDKKSDASRVAIGYFVQTVIENVFVQIIKKEKISNLVLSGGCFYNVKLNNRILKEIPGLLCIMPVAGDQGAPIGKLFFQENIENYDLSKLFTFTFGKRNLSNISKYTKDLKRCFVCELNDDLIKEIGNLLDNNKIVNIVYGDLEFGPRALCHTSTLFKPLQINANINNAMNGRAEVMPTAPVILEKNLDFFFDQSYKRVIGSDRFMIITYDYKIKYDKKFGGIMHKYPVEFNKKERLPERFSGRPQVIYNEEQNPLMFGILNYLDSKFDVKALTNTSFNVHGQPIVFNSRQIIENYKFQIEKCEKLNLEIPYLYIINDKG